MIHSPRRAVAALACAAALLAGCSGEESESVAASPQPDQVYTGIRGIVADLPDASRPASSFSIKHERIAHFVNSAGEAVGMPAMQMPFPLAEGVSIEGLSIGDKVVFSFEVTWDRTRASPIASWQLTEWSRLPDETELDFGGPD